MSTLRGMGFVVLGAFMWAIVGWVAGAMAGAIAGYGHGVHDSTALGEYAARRAPAASALFAIAGSLIGILMWTADRRGASDGRLRPSQRTIVGLFAGALSGWIAASFLVLHLRPLATAIIGACAVGAVAGAWPISQAVRPSVGASAARANPPEDTRDRREPADP